MREPVLINRWTQDSPSRTTLSSPELETTQMSPDTTVEYYSEIVWLHTTPWPTVINVTLSDRSQTDTQNASSVSVDVKFKTRQNAVRL